MDIKNKIKKDIVLEFVKWVSVLLLLLLLIKVTHTHYEYSCYIKNMIVCIMLLCTSCIVLTTRLGKMMLVLGKEAYFELQKIVWPTHHETLNTTLVISAVTIVISLILWGLDTVLVHLISFGLRF